ncbi:hypothetical protein DRO59_03360 [Candidatus Bathyarchaeota archaeon]|nr:MAG: hypothetical protein DRO59_03360 [Candidatus Bathyarchaeota archaeon]
MKYLKWELKNITLGRHAHAFGLGSSEDFIVHLTMFRRKARLEVKTRLGQYLISREHHYCFPDSWEEVFNLYRRFSFVLQNPPSIWKVTQHPKGFCMSLFSSLFDQVDPESNTEAVSLPVPDEVYFQLTLGTSFRTSCGTVKGSLTAMSGGTCFRLTKISLPLLTLAWLLANDGYELARFRWVGESLVYLGGLSSFQLMTYERMCELWVRSSVLSSFCYVPIVTLTKKNLVGLKVLEATAGGFEDVSSSVG